MANAISGISSQVASPAGGAPDPKSAAAAGGKEAIGALLQGLMGKDGKLHSGGGDKPPASLQDLLSHLPPGASLTIHKA